MKQCPHCGAWLTKDNMRLINGHRTWLWIHATKEALEVCLKLRSALTPAQVEERFYGLG